MQTNAFCHFAAKFTLSFKIQNNSKRRLKTSDFKSSGLLIARLPLPHQNQILKDGKGGGGYCQALIKVHMIHVYRDF